MRTSLAFTFSVFGLLVGIVVLAGCSGKPTNVPSPDAVDGDHDHADHEHIEGDGHHHEQSDEDHEHGTSPHANHDQAGSHSDTHGTKVPLPTSLKDGAARLMTLRDAIVHQIESKEFSKLHGPTDELVAVVKKMKELARNDLPEDKQADANRLCNEIASKSKEIHDAADRGNFGEVKAALPRLRELIEKLGLLVE